MHREILDTRTVPEGYNSPEEKTKHLISEFRTAKDAEQYDTAVRLAVVNPELGVSSRDVADLALKHTQDDIEKARAFLLSLQDEFLASGQEVVASSVEDAITRLDEKGKENHT